MAGISLAKLGGLDDIPYGLGLSALCALLGMLIQFATNRRVVIEEENMSRKGSKKSKEIPTTGTVLSILQTEERQ